MHIASIRPGGGLKHLAATATFHRLQRAALRSFSLHAQRPRLRSADLGQSHTAVTSLTTRRGISWTPHSWSSALRNSTSWIPPPHDSSVGPSQAEPISHTASFSDHHTTTTSSAAPLDSSAADSSVTDLGSLDFSTIENVGHVYDQVIPEQIGFLHTLGLEFGWGPTSMIQWSLEHVHVYTGLPWWGSIILTAFGTRVLLVYAAIQSSDAAARMGALKPLTKPVSDRMMAAYKTQDLDVVQKCQQEMREIMSTANIKYSRIFMPLAAQSVIAFSALRLMRDMANLPVPGLRTGGALWFQDLTIADPTYLLPLTMAASLHMLVRFGGENGASVDTNPALRSVLLYVMPCVILVSMSWFPAAVVLWLASTGATGILQAKMLQAPSVREYLNLAPLITKPQDVVNLQAPTVESIIDVKTVKTSFPLEPAQQQPRYQAPKLKFASTSSKKEAARTRSRVTVPEPAPLSASRLPNPRSWFVARANELGNAYESFLDYAKSQTSKRAGKDIPKGRRMTRRQIEDAARYEREFQQRRRDNQAT